jgi:5-methylcytosine-specific restriction endonuclease McrA
MSVKKVRVEFLRELAPQCTSVRQIAIHLGLFPSGSTVTRLRKKLESHNIDISHFTGQLWSKGKTAVEDVRINSSAYTEEEIFCEQSKANPGYVKTLILKQGLLPNLCGVCNDPPVWKGKPLVLQLDHINGLRNDHRLENLRLICPNCHSQTDTYCAKNKKRPMPSREKIIESLKNTKTITEAINYLGINKINHNKILKIATEEGITQAQERNIKYCQECSKEIPGRSLKYCSKECAVLGKNQQSSLDPSTWVHGTASTYDYRKCRCTECRRAHTEIARKYNQSKKEQA